MRVRKYKNGREVYTYRLVENKAVRLWAYLRRYADKKIEQLDYLYPDDVDNELREAYYQGFKEGIYLFMANACKWRFPKK